MHVLTRVGTVRPGPESSVVFALGGEGHVVVDVLAPLHQQVRIDAICLLGGAPYYFLADFPWLLAQ